jgi:hypothetical protein
VHYKRFIELLFERCAPESFSGVYAASLSTSIRFYDHLAHEYIQGITEDLGMSLYPEPGKVGGFPDLAKC